MTQLLETNVNSNRANIGTNQADVFNITGSGKSGSSYYGLGGADAYVFGSSARGSYSIVDNFYQGGVVDLTRLGLHWGANAPNGFSQPFGFSKNSLHELIIRSVGPGTMTLEADLNGDRKADLSITISSSISKSKIAL